MLKKVAIAQVALALAVGVILTHPEVASSTDSSTLAAAPIQSFEVAIENFSFGQKTLTVPVGTTVRWVNRDEEPHTVTETNRVFASPGLDSGEAFSYRFDAPGTYTYICSLHPHMTAQIIVK